MKTKEVAMPVDRTAFTAAERVSGVLCGLLAGLGFVLPVSLAVSNMFWGASLALWVGSLIAERGRRSYRWTGLEIPWLAMIAAGLIAGLLSDNPGHSVRGMKSEVLAAVFLLSSQVGGGPGVRRRLGFFAAGATAAGVLGIAQFLIGFQWHEWILTRTVPPWADGWPLPLVKILSTWHGRGIGFYSHPITYAEMLMLAGFLSLGVGLAGGRKSWSVAGGIAFLGILASQTRGVWLSVFVVVGLWTILRRDRKIMAWALGLVVAAGLALGMSPGLRGRAASVVNMPSDNSNLIRLGLWRRSAEMIREHPWRGVGPGNFLVKPEELFWGGSRPDMTWTEAHNMYLQAAVEQGLPGLGVFLWFLWAVGRRLWRAARSDPSVQGIFFGFVGLLFAGLTESWPNDSEVVMAFYFLAGSALSLVRTAPVAKVIE